MRVLIVEDKHETTVIDATDKDAAILEMVRLFDANEYYYDLSPEQRAWLKEAKKGDMTAARLLTRERRNLGCEYEDHWRFEDVVVPTGKGWK
jgi:hypothetical protein